MSANAFCAEADAAAIRAALPDDVAVVSVAELAAALHAIHGDIVFATAVTDEAVFATALIERIKEGQRG